MTTQGLSVSEHVVTVEYSAKRNRDDTYALSYGQSFMHNCINNLSPFDAHLNMSFNIKDVAFSSLSDAVVAIKTFVENVESLRTTYNFDEDEGKIVQELSESGVFEISVFDSGSLSRDSVVIDVKNEIQRESFNLTKAPLARFAIVTRGGAPEAVICTLSHLAADVGGLVLSQKYLEDLLKNGPEGGGQVVSDWHPQDQALKELGATGANVETKSADHWRETLPLLPQALFFRKHANVSEIRWQRCRIDSARIAVASRLLAERYEVSAASVLAAAFTSLLCYINRTNRCGLRLASQNRFDSKTLKSVGTYVQEVTIACDADLDNFELTCRRLHAQSVAAYPRARYRHETLRCITQKHDELKGLRTTVDIAFNSVLGDDLNSSLKMLSQEALDSLPDANINWIQGFHKEAIVSYFHANMSGLFYMLVDTAYLPTSVTEKIVTAMEGFLVDITLGKKGIEGVITALGDFQFVPTKDWVNVSGSWIHLPTCEGVLGVLLNAKMVRFVASDTLSSMEAHVLVDDVDSSVDFGTLSNKFALVVGDLRCAIMPRVVYVYDSSTTTNANFADTAHAERVLTLPALT